MPATSLRHIAVVADGLDVAGEDPGEVVAGALERAAAVAGEAWTLLPELEVFSFFAPQLEPGRGALRLVEAVPGVLPRAVAALEHAASGRNATLAVRGRPGSLAPALARLRERGVPAGGRALLWFHHYSAREEIARAAERLRREGFTGPVGEDDVARRLDTAGLPDPDLVILAGGPFEPKDFLLWQLSYAELWHGPEPWMRFGPQTLRSAVREFGRRQRRFGR